MQDNSLEDVMEDDGFFSDEEGVTVPAPGMTQGTYVGEYGDSGIFPDQDLEDDIDSEIFNFDQHFSAFTTFSLFACLVVMVTGAMILICMFLWYV